MAWFDRPSVSNCVSSSSVQNSELRKLIDLRVMTNRLGKSSASEILSTCINEVTAAITPQLENDASTANRHSFKA